MSSACSRRGRGRSRTQRQRVLWWSPGLRMARTAPRKPAGGPLAPAFVSYFRVSTDKQGRSGLGLEAQREAVERHVRAAGGLIVAEFEEVESGKRDDRPEIRAAIAACRLRRATLIIAKLDRLARSVAFVSALMESGIEFVACDNPHATRLTIHILAAVAEHEREMISARTKAALQAAKARGKRLGNPRLQPGTRDMARQAAAVRSARAAQHAADVAIYLDQARRAGCSSLGQLAAALNARGIPTASGDGAQWTHVQVRRVIARLNSGAKPG